MSSLGLYLHIPFCSSICNYCNFNRGLFDARLKERYVEGIGGEIGRAGARWRRDDDGRHRADTIFFGGGTPSLLEPDEVGALIRRCRDAFELDRDSEITLEANPETLDLGRAVGFREAGVNRLSLGVQSFRDAELVRLSRRHDASRAAEAVALARKAGFDNVSVDLMMWLPGQSVSEWLESVERLIELGPEHASLYLLEIYPNAPLRDEMARSGWSLAPDEDAADMYLDAMTRLEAAGYEQYEISNVARPGRRSRHNLKYWSDGEWLGFGCGAHSTLGAARWKNVASTEEYLQRMARNADPAVETRQMSSEERLEDALFTGLRLTDGLDLAAIAARYDVDVWRRYGADLAPHVEAGLLVHRDGRLVLTRRGMLLAHEVMTVFV